MWFLCSIVCCMTAFNKIEVITILHHCSVYTCQLFVCLDELLKFIEIMIHNHNQTWQRDYSCYSFIKALSLVVSLISAARLIVFALSVCPGSGKWGYVSCANIFRSQMICLFLAIRSLITRFLVPLLQLNEWSWSGSKRVVLVNGSVWQISFIYFKYEAPFRR